MAGTPRIDVAEIVRDFQDRLGFLLSADRTAGEVVEILRDTHRILTKLERSVDRLESETAIWQERLGDLDVSAKRIDRIEDAVLNIERATLSVEAALGALPKPVRERIRRSRQP